MDDDIPRFRIVPVTGADQGLTSFVFALKVAPIEHHLTLTRNIDDFQNTGLRNSASTVCRLL